MKKSNSQVEKKLSSAEVAKNKDTLYVSDDYDWAVAVSSKALMVYVYDERRLDVSVPVTAFDEDDEFWMLAEPRDLPDYMHIDSSGYHSVMRFIFEGEYEPK